MVKLGPRTQTQCLVVLPLLFLLSTRKDSGNRDLEFAAHTLLDNSNLKSVGKHCLLSSSSPFQHHSAFTHAQATADLHCQKPHSNVAHREILILSTGFYPTSQTALTSVSIHWYTYESAPISFGVQQTMDLSSSFFIQLLFLLLLKGAPSFITHILTNLNSKNLHALIKSLTSSSLCRMD